MNILKSFAARAIIFDKDGTLIDFDAMWGSWTLALADRFYSCTSIEIKKPLCESYGYDVTRGKILADGKLTCTPMWRLRDLMAEVAEAQGMPRAQALQALEQAWHVPDPVTLAKPFTDTRQLFANIQAWGIKIAIATTDDRAPTAAMLEAFDMTRLVDTMVCADDGIQAKPAPDMVSTICARLGIEPGQAIVIGDTVADLQMARAAGAGYVIGVLSGVGSLANLTPLADLLIDTVDTLQASFVVREPVHPQLPEPLEGLTGWNPDPAY